MYLAQRDRYSESLDASIPPLASRLRSGEKTKTAVNNSMSLKQPIQLIQLKHSHEGGLGHFDIADLAHALLALLLLLQQLALTGDVSSVALGKHVLTHGLYGLSGDNLCPDGGLDRYLKLLARDELLELLADTTAEVVAERTVHPRTLR